MKKISQSRHYKCDNCPRKFQSKRGRNIHKAHCGKVSKGIPTRIVQSPPGKAPVRKVRVATKGVEVHITICNGTADVVIKSGVQ